MKNAKEHSALINRNAVDVEQHLDKVKSTCKSAVKLLTRGLNQYEVKLRIIGEQKLICRERDWNNIDFFLCRQL
jgi:hypothetical protein